MRYIKGFYMGLGMFTAIPLPFHIWDEKLTPIMVATLPLIGLLIGSIWWGASELLLLLNAPTMIMSAILTVTPFFLAGFIHLDGYMDTSDALLSRRDMQERLHILKDPLVGAFAVVMLAILFLLQFAAMYTIVESGRYFAMIAVICTLSRACSALAVLALRHMEGSNYAAMLGQKSGLLHGIFVVIVAICVTALAAVCFGIVGLTVSLSVIVGYAAAMRVVYKAFDGVSGDLLGYSLVIGELCGLIALALLQGVLI
ncbi:MAG: adenosylcobinamide-GDP ribazoletransferase [Defluviitaleaceae bacterium]|nr:adenosylcobinamide-GDP ribazoletransferase [Defluviitaleaceae bacterium]